MSGERQKRFKVIGEKPGEVKSLRGDRTALALTPPMGVTDRNLEQHLERAARSTGVSSLLLIGGFSEYEEGTKQRRAVEAKCGENP